MTDSDRAFVAEIRRLAAAVTRIPFDGTWESGTAESRALSTLHDALDPEAVKRLCALAEQAPEPFVVPEADGPCPELEMDSEGYPTDETLEAIRHWPFLHIGKLFDEIARIWHWGYGLGTLKEAERMMLDEGEGVKFLRLATGGWSGNESIIGAMEDNFFVRVYWRLSRNGGLHIYEYPALPLPLAPGEGE